MRRSRRVSTGQTLPGIHLPWRLLHLVNRRTSGVGVTGIVVVPGAAPPGLRTRRVDVRVGASFILENRLRDVARCAGVPGAVDIAEVVRPDVDDKPPLVVAEVLGIG